MKFLFFLLCISICEMGRGQNLIESQTVYINKEYADAIKLASDFIVKMMIKKSVPGLTFAWVAALHLAGEHFFNLSERGTCICNNLQSLAGPSWWNGVFKYFCRGDYVTIIEKGACKRKFLAVFSFASASISIFQSYYQALIEVTLYILCQLIWVSGSFRRLIIIRQIFFTISSCMHS